MPSLDRNNEFNARAAVATLVCDFLSLSSCVFFKGLANLTLSAIKESATVHIRTEISDISAQYTSA